MNPFHGKKIAVTGKLLNYTRQDIHSRLLELEAKPVSVVSRNTDYLIAGANAGSKLNKAKALGITVLAEWEFENIAN